MGAWIETINEVKNRTIKRVAPYVGAWIETRYRDVVHALPLVAPYVGAWIETGGGGESGGNPPSHPTWVRGLKLLFF